MGIRKNKIVAACRDFTRKPAAGQNGAVRGFRPIKMLVPFHDLKNSFMSGDLDSYSGTGSETLLDEVLATIAGQVELKSTPGVLERFWDMFVVDAFIGNNDRNNGNWGVLIDPANDVTELAPVYDNGNAFFNKRGVEQMSRRLQNEGAMREDAWLTPLCAYKYTGLDNEGHRINPFTFVKQGNNADCAAAAERFINNVNMEAIENIIKGVPESAGCLAVMPDVQKEFYIRLLRMRYEFFRAIAI